MRAVCLVLAAFGLFAQGFCATFTDVVSADSFVRRAAPALNYGGAGALSVSGSAAATASGISNGEFESLIRFNTAAMVSAFNAAFGATNWVITGATLRVTELGAPANTLFNRGIGSFAIRWISQDDWIEGTGTPNAPASSGITYNDALASRASALFADLGVFTNSGADARLGFSLSLPDAFATDLRAGGEVGLYLAPIDPAIGFTFDSRSFGTAADRPFLEISALPRPRITHIAANSGEILLDASGGIAGETYRVLSSANAALPLARWFPVATNAPSSDGPFSLRFQDTEPHSSTRYYLLQVRN